MRQNDSDPFCSYAILRTRRPTGSTRGDGLSLDGHKLLVYIEINTLEGRQCYQIR
jgi:hypothetical protein